ncbi:hypothetical protein, partial [Simiaoa sp.]|uniref:hypothetical protein n=1 Tax=Simiaoa sp. TaxID=2944202 RepID=UPI003F81794C
IIHEFLENKVSTLFIQHHDESGNANFKNDRMKCTYEYKVNGISYKKKITFQSPGMVAVKFP